MVCSREKTVNVSDSCSRWIADPWQRCSVTCGGGLERRSVYCVHQLDQGGTSTEEAVSDDQCSAGMKPASSRPCSEKPCPAWFTGIWSPVRPCGYLHSLFSKASFTSRVFKWECSRRTNCCLRTMLCLQPISTN